jgi:hypothetical protein
VIDFVPFAPEYRIEAFGVLISGTPFSEDGFRIVLAEGDARAAERANRPFCQPDQGLIKTGGGDLGPAPPRRILGPADSRSKGADTAPNTSKVLGVAEGPAEGATRLRVSVWPGPWVSWAPGLGAAV